MIYEYEDIRTGERVEIVKPSCNADPLGTIIEHEGRKLLRIISDVPVSVTKDEPRARRNLPKNMPGCSAYDRNGYPVITNAEGRKIGLVPNPHLDNPAWK